MYKATSYILQDYLEARGLKPQFRKGYVAYYKQCALLDSLLARYTIEKSIIPNKIGGK